MAQRVEVVLVDDLDGGTADETVQFALDGVSYEIDLTAANAQSMRTAPVCRCESRSATSMLQLGRSPASICCRIRGPVSPACPTCSASPSGAASARKWATFPKEETRVAGLPMNQTIRSRSWQDLARMMGAAIPELRNFPRTKEWVMCQ